jgi:hypothetical protein
VLIHPLRGLRTVSVAPDRALIAEIKVEVSGNYTILDHAIGGAERGLAATLVVGQSQPGSLHPPPHEPETTGGH